MIAGTREVGFVIVADVVALRVAPSNRFTSRQGVVLDVGSMRTAVTRTQTPRQVGLRERY